MAHHLVVDWRKAGRNGYDVYIGRGPDPRTGLQVGLGNPFSDLDWATAKYRLRSREDCILDYYEWLMTAESREAVVMMEKVLRLAKLRLGCWCAPRPCHGDVIARMANGEIEGKGGLLEFIETLRIATGRS